MLEFIEKVKRRMRVYLVRHGESRTNQRGLGIGWLDEPLTDSGRADAKAAADVLKGAAFDRIYVSDLQRAVETAKIATNASDFEITPALREINVGAIAGKRLGILNDEQSRDIAQFGYGIFGGSGLVSPA